MAAEDVTNPEQFEKAPEKKRAVVKADGQVFVGKKQVGRVRPIAVHEQVGYGRGYVSRDRAGREKKHTSRRDAVQHIAEAWLR